MVHCVPVWPDMCAGTSSPCDWENLVSTGTLPPLKLKQMVGKGWHIQAMGSFVMFLLSAVEVRQKVIMQHPIEWFFEPEDPWDEETNPGDASTDIESPHASSPHDSDGSASSPPDSLIEPLSKSLGESVL